MKIIFEESKLALLKPLAKITKSNAENNIKKLFGNLNCNICSKEDATVLLAVEFYNTQPYYQLQLNTYCCEAFKDKVEA